MPELFVSIVTHDSEKVLSACCADLHSQQGVTWRCRVFDNASTDGTVRLLESQEDIDLVRSTVNIGFAAAHNLNLEDCESEYFLLLNPDTRFPSNACRECLEVLRSRAECAAVAPVIVRAKGVGDPEIHSGGRSYPGAPFLPPPIELGQGEFGWLEASWMIVRTRAFREVGGFDPSFFMYEEDTDLGLRFRRAGWTLEVCESIEVSHALGSSSRSQDAVLELLAQSRVVFIVKHHGRAAARCLGWIRCLSAVFPSIDSAVSRARKAQAKAWRNWLQGNRIPITQRLQLIPLLFKMLLRGVFVRSAPVG